MDKQLTLCDVTPPTWDMLEPERIRYHAKDIAADMARMLLRRRWKRGQYGYGNIHLRIIATKYGLSEAGYSHLDKIGGMVILSSMGCPHDHLYDMAERCITDYLAALDKGK